MVRPETSHIKSTECAISYSMTPSYYKLKLGHQRPTQVRLDFFDRMFTGKPTIKILPEMFRAGFVACPVIRSSNVLILERARNHAASYSEIRL